MSVKEDEQVNLNLALYYKYSESYEKVNPSVFLLSIVLIHYVNVDEYSGYPRFWKYNVSLVPPDVKINPSSEVIKAADCSYSKEAYTLNSILSTSKIIC